MALGFGLVPFTVQYSVLRAFYALEDNRTTFFLQVLIAAVNVVLGVAVVTLLDRARRWWRPGLGLAYSLAYAVGVVVSFRRLRRRLPDLNGEALVRHCVRLIVAVAPAGGGGLADRLAVRPAGRGSRLVLALGLVVGALVAVADVPARGPDAAHPGGDRHHRHAAASRRERMGRGRSADPPTPPPGDSATVISSSRARAEEEPSAVEASQQPDGPNENAEAMAHGGGQPARTRRTRWQRGRPRRQRACRRVPCSRLAIGWRSCSPSRRRPSPGGPSTWCSPVRCWFICWRPAPGTRPTC